MGIKEKKAIAEINGQLNGELGGRLQEVLGASAVEFAVHSEDGIDAHGIGVAGKGICDEVVPALINVCADQDYREEFAKIRKYSFEIKPSLTKPSGYYVNCNLALDQQTLHVVVNSTSSPANGTPDVLKSYLESLF